MTTDNLINRINKSAQQVNNASTEAVNKQPVKATASGDTKATASSGTNSSASKIAEIGANEFLTLLLNQLKTQDPLDPMKSEEFSVQLAQFSQLEQLISMNKKLESATFGGPESMSVMASYLGHEVVLKDQQCSVEGGIASNLLLTVPEGTQSLRVDFINEQGVIVGRKNVDEVEAGRQVLRLDGLDVADGKYSFRVVSVDPSGKFADLAAKATGTVEGFLLEPEPKLLVDGEEVSLDQVVEVHKTVS